MYATGGVWCQLGTTKVSLSLRETLNGSPSSKKPVNPEGVKKVLKKVGSTSTSFIGPACRPGNTECRPGNTECRPGNTECRPGNTECRPVKTEYRPVKTECRPGKTEYRPVKTECRPGKTEYRPVKTECRPGKTECRPAKTEPKGKNIEDSLNDFYQELESLDPPDAAPRPPDQQPPNHDPHTGTENTKRCYDSFQYSGTDPNCHLSQQQQQQHWQQDGSPYSHDLKRHRPSEEDYWRPHQPQMMGFPRPPQRFQPPPHARFSGPFPGPPPGRFVPPRWNPYHHPQDSHHFPPDQFLPPGMCRDPQPRPSPPSHPGGDRWGGCGGDPAWPQSCAAEPKRVNPQQGDCTTEEPDSSSSSSSSSLSLILMRGLPGSGKSTFARELVCTEPSGVILSTDDYFANQDDYVYDPSLLPIAHQWNQSRADVAMQKGRSPLIIDNTNLQAWEMRPYVIMALERGYRIYFQEPNTQWKFDPVELEKRNKHGVPQQKISHMLERFCFPISVETVMTSQAPPHRHNINKEDHNQHLF